MNEIIFYRYLNVNKRRRNEGQIGRSDESKKNEEGNKRIEIIDGRFLCLFFMN